MLHLPGEPSVDFGPVLGLDMREIVKPTRDPTASYSSERERFSFVA